MRHNVIVMQLVCMLFLNL